jgi:hypothetical protein
VKLIPVSSRYADPFAFHHRAGIPGTEGEDGTDCLFWRLSAARSFGIPSRSDRTRNFDGNIPDFTTVTEALSGMASTDARLWLTNARRQCRPALSSASLVGAVLLDEPIRWNFVVGLMVVLLGISIATAFSRPIASTRMSR